MPKTNRNQNSWIEIKAPDEIGAEEQRRLSEKGTDPKKITQDPFEENEEESGIDTAHRGHSTMSIQPANQKSASKEEDRGSIGKKNSELAPKSQSNHEPKDKNGSKAKNASHISEKSEKQPEKEQNGSEGRNKSEITPRTQKQPGKAKKNCDSTPGYYRNVLGPTADEIILQGLNAFWDLTAKIKSRRPSGGGEEEPCKDDEKDKNNGEMTNCICMCCPKTEATIQGKEPCIKNCNCQTGLKDVSIGLQVEVETHNNGIQADTTPQIILVAEYQQTELERANKEIQNDLLLAPDRRGNKSTFTSTQDDEKCNCCIQARIRNKASGSQTNQCKEPRRCCKCCKYRNQDESDGSELLFSPRNFRKTSATYVNEHKCVCQRPPDEVKYALVRISKFNEFLTYEILKSTSKQPKKMPTCVEGTFVLRQLGEEKYNEKEHISSKEQPKMGIDEK